MINDVLSFKRYSVSLFEALQNSKKKKFKACQNEK